MFRAMIAFLDAVKMQKQKSSVANISNHLPDERDSTEIWLENKKLVYPLVLCFSGVVINLFVHIAHIQLFAPSCHTFRKISGVVYPQGHIGYLVPLFLQGRTAKNLSLEFMT